ncbi:hypothetical protein DFS33DRAFT_1442658 [Desarmillaria ectypa]|nr:hypothetical protein DFS33DRAFT_1442658 [Desarmillaria ectypa]
MTHKTSWKFAYMMWGFLLQQLLNGGYSLRMKVKKRDAPPYKVSDSGVPPWDMGGVVPPNYRLSTMRLQIPGHSSRSEDLSKQPGVVRAVWTKKTLAAAFIAIRDVFPDIRTIYDKGLSSLCYKRCFRNTLLAASDVLEKIITLVAHLITANLSDVFGRTEGLALNIWLIVLGEIMKAASPNAAGVFSTIGDVGFVSLLNIFIADTTTFLNRGLWATIPETIASIPSLYIGSIFGGAVLDGPYWRWEYGMWAIILPVAAAPLILVLVLCQRKANRLTHAKPQSALGALYHDDPSNPTTMMKIWKLIWMELDFVGVLLLVASLALILILLTLTGTDSPRLGSLRESSP